MKSLDIRRLKSELLREIRAEKAPKVGRAGTQRNDGELTWDGVSGKMTRKSPDGLDTYSPDRDQWTDLVVSAGAVRVLGVSDPDTEDFKTSMKLQGFDATGGQYVYLEGVQSPHGHVSGTDWRFHVHFANDEVITTGETVTWRLTYSVVAPFKVYPAESTVDVTLTNDANFRLRHPEVVSGTDIVVDSHLIAGTGVIDGAHFGPSTVLIGRLERLSTDTYGGSALLLSADFHILVNRHGTNEEYTD